MLYPSLGAGGGSVGDSAAGSGMGGGMGSGMGGGMGGGMGMAGSGFFPRPQFSAAGAGAFDGRSSGFPSVAGVPSWSSVPFPSTPSYSIDAAPPAKKLRS